MRRLFSLLLLAGLLSAIPCFTAPALAAEGGDKAPADDKKADDKKPDDAKPNDKKPDDAKPADDNPGQADLDKALEKKLSAETLDDLSDVLKYCEAALKAGLSPANAQFANDLYTSTLLQRGTFYTQAIFDRKTGEASPQFRNLRALALADLEKVVARDVKQGPAFLMMAKLENLPDGDRAKGLKAANEAVKLIKDEPALETAALVVRGQLQTDAEKQLADLSEAIKLTPADQEALRSRAIHYLSHNKYEEARKDLDELLKLEPNNELLYQLQGETLFMLKEKDKAMDRFNRAISLRQGSPFPYVNRARIRGEQGDTKGALEDIESALKIQNDNPAALFTRARIYKQTNEADKAKADIETALRSSGGANLFRELLAARGLRAMIAFESGDYKQIIDDLEDLRQAAPQNADLLRQLGVLLIMSKAYDKAIDRFQELLKLQPKDIGVLYRLAILYSLNKQPDKAIETFSQVLEQDPKNFEALRSRGDTYLNIGKHAEAIKDFEEAYKTNPDDSGLLNNYAWVLATSPDDNLRDGKRSVEMGTKACELTEYKKPHILSTLAAGYAETGDFDSAIKWSAKAVEVADAMPAAEREDGETMVDQLKKELDSYKEKKPVRERLTGDEKKKDKKPTDDKPAPDKKDTAEKN